jgi:hypothetical protein
VELEDNVVIMQLAYADVPPLENLWEMRSMEKLIMMMNYLTWIIYWRMSQVEKQVKWVNGGERKFVEYSARENLILTHCEVMKMKVIETDG